MLENATDDRLIQVPKGIELRGTADALYKELSGDFGVDFGVEEKVTSSRLAHRVRRRRERRPSRAERLPETTRRERSATQPLSRRPRRINRPAIRSSGTWQLRDAQ
jgi:hypothetical protein